VPRRSEIKSVLILGSGPIVIGQACEFDYSGTQACRALREVGVRVVLLNSNPATIMTDPELADATYIEPLTLEVATQVIEAERPDALLPTLGGQTALNLAMALFKAGVLERYSVEMIGASARSIEEAEDRELFNLAMASIGARVARSEQVGSLEAALALRARLPLPWVLRPSFTMGGVGGGVVPADAKDAEIAEAVRTALRASPKGTVLIEESIAGWKEYELEMMRDHKDNAVVVCSIENFDPMGIHTGDSITLAPAQTLTDKEYQAMRNEALAILRRIGVDTGGCNIQFAVNPATGERIVIEMNPRVSRSSALASKATGFPIAKIAALLALGYTLDELVNDITGSTPVCFEPSIDYVVTKIPRFAFEKFPGADDRLSTSMRSVGEVMAIGRSLPESLGKAMASLDLPELGFQDIENITEKPIKAGEAASSEPPPDLGAWLEGLMPARPSRLQHLVAAIRAGVSLDALHQHTRIDPFFLRHLEAIVLVEEEVRQKGLPQEADALLKLKAMGLSDQRLGKLAGLPEAAVRQARLKQGVRAVYKRVDTCAAEFEAKTPYLYSCYEAGSGRDQGDEARPSARKKVIILGSGPNRIGQGIEFDYCCVQAAMALKEASIEAVMVNCNPETVSTDYDTSDRLYFEPLTLEHVLQVVETEASNGELLGCIVQFGGQTPLNLATRLEAAGVPILGTPPSALDRAEDREQFLGLLSELGLTAPAGGMARSLPEAQQLAGEIGFPVMVRPSFVLGGRAMKIVHDVKELERYAASQIHLAHDAPVLIDRFLRDAVEVDVDVIFDGVEGFVPGILEHIEEAGIHSGDSACALPPFTLGPEICRDLARGAIQLARALSVVGLLNVQFALLGRRIYVIEANPRASRTVPFVGKATGIPVARLATQVMLGRSLRSLGYGGLPEGLLPAPAYFAVKEAVFPFRSLPGTDPVLGPEMHSTGEVMGLARSFAEAYGKAQLAAGNGLPRAGRAFLSVRDADKDELVEIARRLVAQGFELVGTAGTAARLTKLKIPCEALRKVSEGSPHCVDAIHRGEIDLVVNTPSGRREIQDSSSIRREAVLRGVSYVTTMSAARAAVGAIEGASEMSVLPLQRYHAQARQSLEWSLRLTAPPTPD